MGRFVAGDIEGGVIVADRRRLLADLTPLRESAAFRRLWAGTTLSSVGGALTAFAVMLQVYDLTHSSLAVGAIGVAELVPTLTVGLLCGPVVDAIDRRKLVLVTRARRSPGWTCSGCCTPSSRCSPRSVP